MKKLGGLVCQLVPLFLFYLVVSLAKIALGSEIGITDGPTTGGVELFLAGHVLEWEWADATKRFPRQ